MAAIVESGATWDWEGQFRPHGKAGAYGDLPAIAFKGREYELLQAYTSCRVEEGTECFNFMCQSWIIARKTDTFKTPRPLFPRRSEELVSADYESDHAEYDGYGMDNEKRFGENVEPFIPYNAKKSRRYRSYGDGKLHRLEWRVSSLSRSKLG